MPRRRCVGATVTELIAQLSTAAPPGTVSGATHEPTVPTGAAAEGIASS